MENSREGEVNGKPGKEVCLFSPVKYQPNSLRNCDTEKESLTDRYIQPQLSALALDALFICVPIWRNPPNPPASTKKRERGGERKRQAD